MSARYTQRTDSLGAIALWIGVMVIIGIVFACAGCAVVPEKKVVTSVETIPPVQVPLPVSCVKKVPEPVTIAVCVPVGVDDPDCTPLRRYYLMKALIAAYDEYRIAADIEIKRCVDAVKEPPK